MNILGLSSEFELGDALKTIVQSLQLTTLLPTILLVASIVLLFYPSLDELDITAIGLLIFAAVSISFLFHTLNMPLIRLWEGYIWNDAWLMQQLRISQLKLFDEMKGTIRLCKDREGEIDEILDDLALGASRYEEDERILEGWKRGWRDHRRQLFERLEERFPPSRRQVLPTSLGNAIAAFEWYPFERYRMDTIQLWTRFVPVLAAKKYAVYVQNEKAILDFLINMLSGSVVVFLASLVKFGISGNWIALVIAGGLIGIGYVLFKAAVVAAANWGGTVKAAFDLYRHDLRHLLCLHLPKSSLEGEREMWQGVSDFLAFNNVESFQGFEYDLVPSGQQEKQKETRSILLPGGGS